MMIDDDDNAGHVAVRTWWSTPGFSIDDIDLEDIETDASRILRRLEACLDFSVPVRSALADDAPAEMHALRRLVWRLKAAQNRIELLVDENESDGNLRDRLRAESLIKVADVEAALSVFFGQIDGVRGMLDSGRIAEARKMLALDIERGERDAASWCK